MTSLTQEQRVKIVLFYGKYENINRVRTEFAKFYEISNQPRQVPSYMMIKRVVDRFLSTGSVHICSQNQNIPVQTANGHSAACPRPRWGGWRRTCWSERASTWRAATSSTCSRNTRIGLPRNEYSKSPSILWRIDMLLCLKCWNITVLDVVTSFCHLCSNAAPCKYITYKRQKVKPFLESL